MVKLGKLNKSNKDVSTNEELKQMNLITKYAILSVISVMLTTLVIISIIYSYINNEWRYIDGAFQAITGAFDVLCDSLCMYLSLNINDKQYHYVCSLCDSECKIICAKCYTNNEETRNTIRENTKLHSIVSLTSLQSSALNTPTNTSQ